MRSLSQFPLPWFCPTIADLYSYTFDLSVEAQDFPKIGHRLRWGANEVRWDVCHPHQVLTTPIYPSPLHLQFSMHMNIC
jgi:hypothetical protein